MRLLKTFSAQMRNEESGLSSLEIAGLIAFVLSLLALITPLESA